MRSCAKEPENPKFDLSKLDKKIQENLNKQTNETIEKTTAGAEKEFTNKINKTGQEQRADFDVKDEAKRVARQEKAIRIIVTHRTEQVINIHANMQP